MTDNKKFKGITLALSNQKGGVGKTTTVSALASIYADRGLKVLVVDNDPQANLSLQFGIDYENKNHPGSIADLYEGKKRLEEVVVETEHGAYLIPAMIDLARIEMYLPGVQGGDLKLKKIIDPVRDAYDLILIDAPPNLGKLAVNALTASDWYLVPVDGPWGLRSLDTLISVAQENTELYRDVKTQLLGIVLTMRVKTKIMANLRESTSQRYPSKLLKSEIRRSTIALESSALQTPIPIYAKDSTVAEDYRALADELAQLLQLY